MVVIMDDLFIKYACIGVFVLVMAGVGIYSANKVKGVDDFLLGGRALGPWLAGFCYGTTYFSAVIFIGYASTLGWQFGISAVWIGIGNALLGSLLAWLVLAKRTRKMTHQLNASTMPEFFEKRYGSKLLRIVSAGLIFIFLVPYSASVYKGLSYLFESVFGINFTICIVIMAVLTGIYLLLGGYVATAINDFIQGCIMLVGIIAVVIFVVNSEQVGGVMTGVERLGAIDANLSAPFGGENFWDLLSLVVLTSLGTWGLPQMIHKFYTIKDNKAINIATVISTVFAIVVATGCYFVGAFGQLFFDKAPEVMDTIVPQMLLAVKLPAVLLGIIAVLVLSASMSTLSSLVLVSSSSIAVDFCKGYLFKDMKDKNVMLLMRGLCVVFVILSVVIALVPNGAIVQLMALSWGTLAGCFLAPFMYGLYMKKANACATWTSFALGLVLSVGLPLAGIPSANAGAIAMFATLIVYPIVAVLTDRFSLYNYETAIENE